MTQTVEIPTPSQSVMRGESLKPDTTLLSRPNSTSIFRASGDPRRHEENRHSWNFTALIKHFWGSNESQTA